MNQLVQINQPPWTRDDIVQAVPEFVQLYDRRPIRNNSGGMKSPHMFAAWFMARYLAPPVIVESGVFKGQSTWLFEQACPEAQIISIDINLAQREYISDRVTYSDTDFSEQDWSKIDTQSALVFFDDHQDAYARLQLCHWFGFRHVIFEDNYASGRGDCYSLKKAFAGSGFEAPRNHNPVTRATEQLARRLHLLPPAMHQHSRTTVTPNTHDAEFLKRHLDVYFEFPPLFRREQTRWGDDWTDERYPTTEAVLASADRDRYSALWDEATSYTWICYAQLRASQ